MTAQQQARLLEIRAQHDVLKCFLTGCLRCREYYKLLVLS